MLRISQNKLFGFRPPIGAVTEALDWLCENDRIDQSHIEAVCFRQGAINTDWSGFVEDNDPLPGPNFHERQARYRRHSCYEKNSERIKQRKLAAKQRLEEEAAAQQLAWEAEQLERQLEKERFAEAEWQRQQELFAKKGLSKINPSSVFEVLRGLAVIFECPIEFLEVQIEALMNGTKAPEFSYAEANKQVVPADANARLYRVRYKLLQCPSGENIFNWATRWRQYRLGV